MLVKMRLLNTAGEFHRETQNYVKRFLNFYEEYASSGRKF